VRAYDVFHPTAIPRGARVMSVRHGHDTYEFINYDKDTHQLIDNEWWQIHVLED